MKRKNDSTRSPSLKPQQPLLFISNKGISNIPTKSILPALVGEKAFGLSCLPKEWTLPFIVISNELLAAYRSCSSNDRKVLLKRWCKNIIKGVVSIGIGQEDFIIVRSSGHSEGLEERGKFYSANGTVSNIQQVISNCLEKLKSDKELSKQNIPLIIQEYIIPFSAKGHLSNERRVYEEDRDWLGQFEGVSTRLVNRSFKINLRNWRKKVKALTDQSLNCNLIEHIPSVLESPAAWGYEKHLRLHFEWVWDGEHIYIVQMDQEDKAGGSDPTKLYQAKFTNPSNFNPKCLKEIVEDHASKYNKIHNVFTYLKLGLPVTKIYVLDDQKVINQLVSGSVPNHLRVDLLELLKRPLIIRTDISVKDKKKSQMLPREEVHDINEAIRWLKKNSSKLRKEIKGDIIFIFHNFIPAISSAFAYAAPGERIVQIEALWGLPEGLYFYSHDKYIVDTHRQHSKDLLRENINDFEVNQRCNFKQYFVTQNQDGKWTTQTLKRPYDWKPSIRNQEWVKEIAYESRRIALKEGKSLSIMWFVDVPKEICIRPIFPWHHEVYDPEKIRPVLTERTKTDFDKTLSVRTNKDLEELQKEAKRKQSNLRRIKIQPIEENLLRDKDMLRDIGKLAKKIGATILLEGGELSHAYYQLRQTEAVVQIQHPFENTENKQDFNKLVRDKVPLNVEKGGEIVKKAFLKGEFLLRALREKLVEEAFEVLDARNTESIIAELADVNEIIDTILLKIGLTRGNLKKFQDQKREKAGGFTEGVVLLETKNPLPTKKKMNDQKILFNENTMPSVDQRMLGELSHEIKKWSDRRGHPAAKEVMLDLIIPSIKNNWAADTSEIILDSGNSIRVKLTGERVGSKFKIKLSAFTPQKQDKLL